MLDSKLIVGWFDAYAQALVFYARQFGDAADAEDLVHDAFVRLIAQQKVPDDPPAWLFRSVRNAAISMARARRRRTRRESHVSHDRPDWFESRADDLIDAKQARDVLESLPLEQREMVVLRIWGGLGFQQIADLLGVSVSTAFDRYKAALTIINAKMEKSSWKTNRKND